MPYISPNLRLPLDKIVAAYRDLRKGYDVSAGEMNYLITRLVITWLPKTPAYYDYNAVLGVLEAVKLELYRRQLSSYEDLKMAENGDAYTGYGS